MIERAVVEYIANALWQIPLLAGGAWLFLWALRPGARTQYGVWLAVLGMGVLLPMHGMGSAGGSAMQVAQARVGPDSGGVGGTSFAPGFAPDVAPDFARDAVPDVAPVSASISVSSSQAQPLKNGESETPLAKKEAPRKSWFDVAPRVRQVSLTDSAVNWVVGMYVSAILFGMLRVARAWRAARRLVEDSWETTVCSCEMAYLEGYGERLGVELPRLRESCAVSSPMVVGVVAPVLLLPEGFGRHTDDEVRAALCHELAHVKRRDYLVNLICQVAALPVAWHPVTYGVQQRIRRTREMVCDAMAAREMQSEIGYARCLLAMARSMLRGEGMVEQAGGLGLFGNNILEERVMRLMETKTAMSVRAKVARAAGGATIMIAAITMAAMLHVAPMMAEQNTAAAPQSVRVASGTSLPQAAVDVLPASVAPVAPVGTVALLAPVAPSAAVPVGPLAPVAPVGVIPAVAAVPAVPVVSAVAPVPVPGPITPTPAPQSSPAPVLAPVAPAPPDPASAPGLPSVPAPPSPEAKDTDGGSYAIVNGERRELTPEEKSEIDRAVAEAKAKIDSPEFRKQMADARRQAAEAAAKINSPEFRKQIQDAVEQSHAARDYINSPEFKKQMEDAQRQAAEAAAKINSPEFRKQIQDAVEQSRAARDYINSPEFKQKMDELQKNSVPMKDLQMQKMQMQLQGMANFNTAELQRQMEGLHKQLQISPLPLQMKELQRQLQSGDMQREMTEAMKRLMEAQGHSGECQPGK
jgi:beta-lactamase regulating signal transducer with metallopeptidase domain